jgi:hypothetical protein
VKVARDKETGQLRAPTADESAELTRQARTIAPDVLMIRRPVTTVETRADGSKVGKLSPDAMEDLLLETTAGGKSVMRHSDEPVPAAATADAELPLE